MSERALRPCLRAGCRALVANGFCADHAGKQRKTYDRWRGSAKDRGYDADWRRVRLLALERDHHLCVHCLRAGRAVPASDVDHIVPVEQAPALRLELSNLQSLCRSCHVTKTAAERQATRTYHPGVVGGA